MVFNIHVFRQNLQRAAHNHDPNAMTQLVKVVLISGKKTGKKPRKHKEDPLLVDETDYGALLSALLNAHSAAEVGDADECYQAQSAVHSSFNRIFSASEGNWLVPALILICKNTHSMALLADRSASGRRSRDANLQSAVQLLQDSYSKTFNDRTEYHPGAPFDTEGSKKAGVLAIVNILFSVYFKLNILRLCKNLIRPVETRKLNETGTMGQMVTYRYFIGRLNMFEDQHALAEKNLDFAFEHCHRNFPKNKRCILRYLIPIKLYRGRLPTMTLIEKYGLEEFKPLVDGIQKGDLRTFQDGLVKYQDRFIRQGTYLLLEKCKTVCYRNLFKRVHNILGKHQISLNDVVAAFKWLGLPIDLDEVECILANLIFRGYVRGYLSHTKRVLVLSKRDPFPISAIIAK